MKGGKGIIFNSSVRIAFFKNVIILKWYFLSRFEFDTDHKEKGKER
jgi:hypothetical protein